MKLESDRFANNQWPDEEFKKELEVVKEERRLRTEDQPRAMLAEQLFAATFTASPYRRPIVGWMSDLDAMTPERCARLLPPVVHAHQRRRGGGGRCGRVPGQVARWPRSITAACPPTRCPRASRAPSPRKRACAALPSRPRPSRPMWRWHSVHPACRVDNLTEDRPRRSGAHGAVGVFNGYDGARLDRSADPGRKPRGRQRSSGAMVTGRGPSLFMLSGVPAAGKTPSRSKTPARRGHPRRPRWGQRGRADPREDAVDRLHRVRTRLGDEPGAGAGRQLDRRVFRWTPTNACWPCCAP